MQEVVDKLIEKNKTISVMESCTGGSVSNSITNIPGASNVFNFGAVTYSNIYKIKMGVNSELIEEYSVYSPEVAKDMARAITEYTNSNYGIGITGKLNKPDPNNPYGEDNTVYICILDDDNSAYYPKTIILDEEDRIKNKEQIIKEIKELLLELLK
jgi:PncC family amidohydrolase